jgi:hypothetical protein
LMTAPWFSASASTNMVSPLFNDLKTKTSTLKTKSCSN